VLSPLIEDIKELKNGFTIEINSKYIWIIGRLGNITADLPEGNEQTEIKHYNANYNY
ncbi:13948_t:CDS:1, partial [Funneliformis mosseae]